MYFSPPHARGGAYAMPEALLAIASSQLEIWIVKNTVCVPSLAMCSATCYFASAQVFPMPQSIRLLV